MLGNDVLHDLMHHVFRAGARAVNQQIEGVGTRQALRRLSWSPALVRRFWRRVHASPMAAHGFSRRYHACYLRVWRRYLKHPVTSVDEHDHTLHAVWATLGACPPFQTLVATEVYEHIPPAEAPMFLTKCFSNLLEAGRLLLSVPLAEDLDRNLCYCPTCDHFFHRWQHVRSLTLPILAKELTDAGFVIEKVWWRSLLAWNVELRWGWLVGTLARLVFRPDHLLVSAWKPRVMDRT